MGENPALLGLAAHLIGGGGACIFRMTGSNIQNARIQEQLMTMAPVDGGTNYVNCTDKSLLDYYCLNGGTCLQLVVAEGENPVLCNCSVGWYGKRCEYHESAGPFYVTEKSVMDYVPFICGAILLFLIVVLTSGSIIYYKKYRRRAPSDDQSDQNQADHFDDFGTRNNHCGANFGLTNVSSTIKRLSRSLSGRINRINNS
uniref:EGF-like domain-containing protein n=1 Tax=Romanomermis culicivorax TaxID=13658 RepID=A0A915I6U9_ROMCU